jgi:glycosyltransferase involved in cell wall biosynthesis
MPTSPERQPGRPPVRVALVHDWLTGMRGGEKVLEVLCERYPQAEIFTLLHIPGSVSATIEQLKIHTSFIQRLPDAPRRYRQYLPLFPLAVRQFDLRGFDLVISTSHCVAKSAIKAPGARHFCYCLTPMRYAWDQFDAYFGPARLGPWKSRGLGLMMGALAWWDERTANRPDRYVAISQYVARRIRRYYNRGAAVVYPPVDTAFYHPAAVAADDYALVVSALVPYKRVDLAIAACQRAGVPLRIVGQGPEEARLREIAGADVTFLGARTDEEIRDLYRRAALLVFPGEEDFGIVPLEAQACGRPVVALGRGGALETVIEDETGLFVGEPTPDAFADAITRARARDFDRQRIRAHAERFGRDRFAAEIETVIDETLTAPDTDTW